MSQVPVWLTSFLKLVNIKACQQALFAMLLGIITFLVIDKIFLATVDHSAGLMSWWFVIETLANLGFCLLILAMGNTLERLALGYVAVWFACGLSVAIYDAQVLSPMGIITAIITTLVLWYFLLLD